nr:unnamed protein product [Callosobruchus chinensis]
MCLVRCFNCSRFGRAKKDCKNNALCVQIMRIKLVILILRNVEIINYMKNQTRTYKPFPVDHAASDKSCPYIARKCEVCDVDIRRGSAKVKCSNVTCDVTLHQKCFSSIAKVIKLEKSEWLCKNCDEESDTSTTATVKANVNPAAEKIAINGTKLIKNGILINCSNEESLEKLKSAVEAMFSNKYKIATPKPFKPRLLVSDVEKSLENRNDFRESLVQNNTFLEDCDIKVIAVIKLKYSINFIILKLIQMCENR